MVLLYFHIPWDMNNHRKINCKVKEREKVKPDTVGCKTFGFGRISALYSVSEKLVWLFIRQHVCLSPYIPMVSFTAYLRNFSEIFFSSNHWTGTSSPAYLVDVSISQHYFMTVHIRTQILIRWLFFPTRKLGNL